MKIVFRVVATAAMLSTAITAQNVSAQAMVRDDHNGYMQIAVGEYLKAERVVNDARRMFPNDPDLLLNLAVVYRRTGRTADARRLYQRVLARPDTDLDLSGGGTVSSHALAQSGLHALNGELRATR